MVSARVLSSAFSNKILGQPKGSRMAIKGIHQSLKDDVEFQDALQDPEAMKILRKKFDEAKAEEKIAAIRVSRRAEAKSVAEKINVFQREVSLLLRVIFFYRDFLFFF